MAKSTWNIDSSHSEVGFIVRHMVVAKVRGQFTSYRGTIELDPENLNNGSVRVEVDADSVTTRDEKRDAHLRSQDFFGAEAHPTLTFTSTAVRGSGKRFELDGELTMRGVKRPVTLKVEHLGKMKDPWGNDRLLFNASTRVNRKEWGLNWNQALEMGGVLVSEDVDIEVDVQLVKAS